ncbi:MAG: S8 family serine peptidase, partial [Chloroflexota bacterium]
MTNFSTPDNVTNVTDSQPESPALWPAWGGRFFLLAFLFWIMVVSYAAQTGVWFAIGFGSGGQAEWLWLRTSLIQVGLTAVPLLPFAFWWPHHRYRAVYQTWLAATLVPLLLASTRLFYPIQSQMVLLSQTILLLLLAGGLWLRYRPQLPAFFRPIPAAAALAAALALLINLPFVWWGALGSPLDTLLALALGLLFGIVAGLVNGRYWLRELAQTSQGAGWDMFTGGLVVGASLLIMSSGLSFNGVQIMLMVALPALGWAAMGAALTGRQPASAAANSLPLGLLSGLSAALALMFTDSDGLYLGAADGILRWAFQAAFLTIPAALLAGFLLLLLRKRLMGVENGRFLTAFALVAFIMGLGFYLTAGQPGFFGDRLFVILKEQADTSAAAQMDDYDARRQYVYDTLTNHANADQTDLRAALDRFGVAYTPYYLTNALEVRGGLLHRLWLSTRPEVDRVIASPVMRPIAEELAVPSVAAAAPAEPDWNLSNIGADRVWGEFGVTGAGIVIGQSDSGAEFDHPELLDSYRGQNNGSLTHSGNWFDPWNGTTAPVDANGHGTHTLGTVLGNVVGVAPDAEWFACANLSRNLGNPALYL